RLSFKRSVSFCQRVELRDRLRVPGFAKAEHTEITEHAEIQLRRSATSVISACSAFSRRYNRAAPKGEKALLSIQAVGFDHDFRRHLLAINRKLHQIRARIERGAEQSAETPATATSAAAESSLRRPLLPRLSLLLLT